ncbi:hypothetical protein [Phaffia rhodozyma]|uniref:Flavin-containing amine oxidasedehydrogenase n=1 Tax=Phaffia rhodozyma TaxID=264483 RepID=A0A0F7SMX1_PHARH|nr:hypothetical protein [Phaffia rhodozyma]
MPDRKRICIIGAGAAGMSTALAFSAHPDRYHITVFDKEEVAGGMATSADLEFKEGSKDQESERVGSNWVNDGVQGCSPAFYNTIKVLDMLGYQGTEVNMQISFGKGEEEFWTNVFPSSLIERFKSDIAKFGRVLKVIQVSEPIFVFVSVQKLLKIFLFDKEFGDLIVYPLVALFFGTGNQTPFIPSTILSRVFSDPSMKLFEFSSETFLDSVPKMMAFPRLSLVYKRWQEEVSLRAGKDGVTWGLGKEIAEIVTRSSKGKDGKCIIRWKEGEDEGTEAFDEIVFACDADAALKILGKQATWREKFVLGNVKYLYDVTYTHQDAEYMQKYYELKEPKNLKSDNAGGEDQQPWNPLYFIHSYPEDRKKLEMSFDLTVYQPQFENQTKAGPKREWDESDKAKQPEREVGDHVFQTIFLNKEDSEHWTVNDIRKEKILGIKWWKQQSHRWQHYIGCVALMMFINGKNHTRYAGAWTVLNMHEIAVTSGFAAAYSLGADYLFSGDKDASRLFKLVVGISYGSRVRKSDRSGLLA